MKGSGTFSTWQPGEDIYGKTFGEWTANFWLWLTKFPLASSPGRLLICDLIQSDPNVFYLAGFLDSDGAPGDPTENQRNCTIKGNKSILVGVINKLSTTREDENLSKPQLLIDRANSVINMVENSTATIDGTVVDLARVYLPFTLDLGDDADNFFGNNGTVKTSAASDGYWLFLKPNVLSEGPHTLHIQGRGPDNNGNLFTTDVTYNLTIS